MSAGNKIFKTVLAVLVCFAIFSILYFFSETHEGYKASIEAALYRVVISFLCLGLFVWFMSRVWARGKTSE